MFYCIWLLATPVSPGTTLCSVAEDEKLLAAKWDFESSDGLAMKKCAILAEPGHGNCLKLLAQRGRAVATGVQIRRSEQGRDNMTRVTKGEE